MERMNWLACAARGVRRYMGPALVVALLVSSVLKVVSSAAHAAAYRAISSIGAVLGEVALDRLLSQSPTRAAERRVVSETGRLRVALAEAEVKRLAAEANLRKLGVEHSVLQAQTAKRAEAIKRFSTRTVEGSVAIRLAE